MVQEDPGFAATLAAAGCQLLLLPRIHSRPKGLVGLGIVPIAGYPSGWQQLPGNRSPRPSCRVALGI